MSTLLPIGKELNYLDPSITKYEHIKQTEMKRIIEKLDFINDSKMLQYQKFLEAYPDLKVFENNINSLPITDFPHWYIILLVCYRRIDIDLNIFLKLQLSKNASDFIKLGHKYIDERYFNTIKNIGVEILKYDKRYISEQIGKLLMKLIVYSNKPIQEIVYMQDLMTVLSQGNKHSRNITKFKILRRIVNIIEGNGRSEQKPEIKPLFLGEEVENIGLEFIEMLIKYNDYYKVDHSYKTLKSELSHIRAFYKYINKFECNLVSFSQINHQHITAFKENQKYEINSRGKTNDASTINHRLQSLSRFFKYISENGIEIKKNLVSEFDMLIEPKKLVSPISHHHAEEIRKAIMTIDEEKHLCEKAVLIIMCDTGRRVHEVLCLSVDSVYSNKLYFHKTKQGFSHFQDISDLSMMYITRLKERAIEINEPLYSKYDNCTKLRLFTSNKHKGGVVITPSTVNNVFKKAQIANNIVDDEGKALFTSHDNKRNFISSLLSKGVDPRSISIVINQKIDTLPYYEAYNNYAIDILNKVEKKGYLLGNKINLNKSPDNKENISDRVLSLVKDLNVVKRNKENLLYKINNPNEGLPVFFGYCIDNENVETCGDLICYACENFRPDNIEDFKKYAIKIISYLYKNRELKNKKQIISQLEKSLENIYMNKAMRSKKEYEKVLKDIKKQVKEEINNGQLY